MKFLYYYIEKCKLIARYVKFQIWLRTKGVHTGFFVKKSFFKLTPQIGNPEKFRNDMLKLAKPTRELLVQEGQEEPLPVTKVAGQPWWPKDIERPTCKHGHSMNFIAQILLSDVPLPNMPENALLSFHYCDECTKNGQMSFGCFDTENRGYDLSIFFDIDKLNHDARGIVAPSLTKSYKVSFRNVDEVPGGLAEDTNIERINLPKDFPQGKDDFDEDIYLGLKHVSRSKIGGWPSWAQYPEWPIEDGKRYIFLGQLDWKLFYGCPWCLGGYAYLFIIGEDKSKLKAELLIQVT